jgi:ribosomal protein S24E
MKALIEKVCEPSGAIFYRVSMKTSNGAMKSENYARLFDAKNGAKKIEMEALKYRIDHFGYTDHEKLVGFIDE